MSLLLEALKGGVELEGPQEVVGFLEVGTDGNDLMDEVFNARDTRLAKNAINYPVDKAKGRADKYDQL